MTEVRKQGWMSKTLSAALTRVQAPAHSEAAPGDESQAQTREQAVRPSVLPLRPGSAPRQAAARRPVRSNLGEPAGMFSWERDFLLALAADVLEDFVEHDHEEDEQSGRR
jgi:hypothetical protein